MQTEPYLQTIQEMPVKVFSQLGENDNFVKPMVRNLYPAIVLVWAFCASVAVYSQPSYQTSKNSSAEKRESTPIEMLNNMLASCEGIQCMRFEVKKTERVNNQYLQGMSAVKMQTKPFQVYLKQYEPTVGLEVLYREGENNNKAIINPNGFPWMNVSLDPYGSTMRKNQHHLIYDIGFTKFNGIIEHLMAKYGSKVEQMIHHKGEKVVSGRKCHVLEFHNPNFQTIAYTVGANETTFSIAQRFKLSEYRIIELNNSITEYGAIKAGSKIILPSDYSPKLKLFIDQQLMVPVRFEVYDESNQLFESYEYQNIEINVKFASDELKCEYPDYGF
jgi:hypothetical protein